MKQFFVKLQFILLSFCCFQINGFSQNYIEEFLVEEVKDQIKISLKTQQKFEYKVMPFDSRVYTLMKIYPVQFHKEKKDQMLAPLKNLSVTIQALELMDQSIMLAFKDVYAKQIHINVSEETKQIEITLSPKIFTNLGGLNPEVNKNKQEKKVSVTGVKDPEKKQIKPQAPSDNDSDLPVNGSNPSSAKSYIQLGLFFLIILTVLAWGIALWQKRKYFTGVPKSKTGEIPELAKQIVSHLPELIKMDQPDYQPAKQILNPVKITSSSVYSPVDQMSRDLSSKEELEDKIYSFASMGFCVAEIAKQLGLGKGEVRLILNYKEKQIPMEAPQMRIEMDN